MRHLCLAAATLFALAPVQHAFASSSDWYQVEGGGVRLLSSGLPDADGRLKGVLEINLNPGWKTYWRDPGDAGVPPRVDVSAAYRDATIEFPVPSRHEDGYSKWAGYDHPVALPVTFTLKQPGLPGPVEASVFLGICQTICIPVQASFVLDPAADPDNYEDKAAVEAAFRSLPAPATGAFGIRKLSGDGQELVLEALVPAGAGDVELFLAGSDGYLFGAPKRKDAGGMVLFTVPVLSAPAAAPAEGGLHYTLATNAGAVSGLLPYF